MSRRLMRTQPGENTLQIVGQRAYKLEPSSIRRVLEREACGVKKWTLEARDDPKIARHASVDAAVQAVADNGMTDGAQMDPDLMRAAGVDRDSRECQRTAERLG